MERWIQFQKESKIKTKMHDQNTIKEAHSCLVKTILQAVEKTISITSPGMKKRPLVAWCNEECEREKRIVRIAEYRKHRRDPTNVTKLG